MINIVRSTTLFVFLVVAGTGTGLPPGGTVNGEGGRPAGGDEIPETAIARLQGELNKAQTALATAQKERDKKAKELAGLRETHNDTVAELKELRQKYEVLTEDLKNAKARTDDLKKAGRGPDQTPTARPTQPPPIVLRTVKFTDLPIWATVVIAVLATLPLLMAAAVIRANEKTTGGLQRTLADLPARLGRSKGAGSDAGQPDASVQAGLSQTLTALSGTVDSLSEDVKRLWANQTKDPADSFPEPTAELPERNITRSAAVVQNLYREAVGSNNYPADIVFLTTRPDPSSFGGPNEPVNLEEVAMQGDFILFRDDTHKSGWLFPNPQLRYRPGVLSRIFPRLTETAYEANRGEIEPVTATQIDRGRWQVRNSVVTQGRTSTIR